MLAWAFFGFFWLGVLLFAGGLIHPAIELALPFSAIVLAVVVGWWMVRARRDPSTVAALACWWFAASTVLDRRRLS